MEIKVLLCNCKGPCDSEPARGAADPSVAARAPGCQLSHEAAVGPIAEDVVEYLMTRGLPRDEATSTLVLGFLKLELPGLPAIVMQQLNRVLAATAGKLAGRMHLFAHNGYWPVSRHRRHSSWNAFIPLAKPTRREPFALCSIG